MNKVTLLEKFKKTNIIKDGHFKLTSGRHSGVYNDKDALYSSQYFYETVCQLTDRLIPERYDFITGPAVAGAVLASAVCHDINAHSLETCRFVYPEKIAGEMKFRRGYDKLLDGKNVLIVEDVITTGGSIVKTIESIEYNGGVVVEIIAIWNRSDWRHEDIPTISLFNEPAISWTPEHCPLCQNGIPLIDPKTGLEIIK